jgi:N-acetylglucosamine kinase-like BadF-type ATPase
MIILGVNGGGTRTRAMAYKPDGTLIGSGYSGSSNYHNMGLRKAAANIREAVSKAGIRKADIACVALAGMDADEHFDEVMPAVAGLARKVVVEQDSFAELYAETRGGKGVIAVAGTGSSVIGTDGKRRFRASGCGWLLSDDGSGYAIGREGLRSVCRAMNAGYMDTLLTKAVLDEVGAEDLNGLVIWAYKESHNIGRIAQAAIAVDKAAKEGDEEAVRIIKEAGGRLASYANDIAMKVGVRKVYCTGGMFKSHLYAATFSGALKKHGVDMKIAKNNPAVGAACIAADRLGGIGKLFMPEEE